MVKQMHHDSAARRYRLLAGLLGAIALVLALLAFGYRSEARYFREQLFIRATGREAAQGMLPIWGDFLSSGEPVLVVYSNTVFKGTPHDGMRLLKPLDSPTQEFGSSASLLDSGGLLGGKITDHYTGVGEVAAVYLLGRLFGGIDQPFRVKRSLLLTWDDLKNSNVIILGSPAENFLLRELPQRQDFVFRVLKNKEGEEQFGILNLRPRENEQGYYLPRMEGPSMAEQVEDYALVSMLRGLRDNRRLFILAGIRTSGTEAAAEYVSNPRYMAELVERLKIPGSSRLPSYYQVLLKVKVNGGVPVQISYLTHRVLEE